MRGRSEVELAQDALCLSQCGEVLPEQLPWGSVGVQNEFIAWCAQLGRNDLVVWVAMQILGVVGVLLPLQDDDGGLHKVIQCLNIESNDLPLDPTVLGRAILWIIGICVEFVH